MLVCSCIICRKEYPVKGIHTHVERSHIKQIKYSSGNNGQYVVLAERLAAKHLIAEAAYLTQPNKCLYCLAVLPYRTRHNQHCSSSCAASAENKRRKDIGWTRSEQSRRQISEKLTGRVYVQPILVEKICPGCKETFSVMTHYTRPGKRFCSAMCGKIEQNAIARANRPALVNYRADCKFKFGLSDYPTEFDFALIEEHGWYKPKNRGDNLTGVSRDHMVSVRYGFDNNIPAEHLRHPANCRLLTHSKNVSKGINNSVTYDELLLRIANWDLKYNT